MTSESNPSERVEHPDGPAWEMAHAMKPFRDAEIEYRDQLSDSARQALDWIASKEAEKAVAAYEATRSEEDPAVRVLREKAEATLEVPQSIAKLAERPDTKIGTLDAKEWVRRNEWGIREFGREAVDEILMSSADNQAKLARLQAIPGELGYGLMHVAKQWERQEGESERWHGADSEVAKGGSLASWGAIIGDIMAGEGVHEYIVTVMAWSGGQPGRAIPIEKIIDPKINFFGRARVSFPAVGAGLDKSLERYGWVWDEKQRKYIKL